MDREITSINEQKRNPQRVNICLDGVFAFGLSRMAAAWLKPGQKLSAADIDRLVNEDELEVAYQKALNYLSYRARSENEVRQSLIGKGFAPSICDDTIVRLKEDGYVDDKDFAVLWIENRSTFRPRSYKLLSMELHQKGLPDDIINKALEDFHTPEQTLAYQAAKSKAERYRALDWLSFRKKMEGFLSRRGFTYATSNLVVKKIWDELRNESESQ